MQSRSLLDVLERFSDCTVAVFIVETRKLKVFKAFDKSLGFVCLKNKFMLRNQIAGKPGGAAGDDDPLSDLRSFSPLFPFCCCLLRLCCLFVCLTFSMSRRRLLASLE